MDLSLVIPCYKEETHLEKSVERLVEMLDISIFSYELIFVDDASPDHTGAILDDLCDRIKNARYLRHTRNKGRGAAFKTGVREARGDIVGFIDIDLEIDASFIPPMIHLIKNKGFDVVSGLRYYVYSQIKSLTRFYLSSGYRIFMRTIIGIPLKDTETGCKFFSQQTGRRVIFESMNDGWFWDTEVMARSYLSGLKIQEMPVLFLRKPEKASTVRVIPDALRYIRDLMRFRKDIGMSFFRKSPIYWRPWIYRLFMALPGLRPKDLFKRTKEQIADGSSVLDLCSGDGDFYTNYLKGKNCRYIGLDWNNHSVIRARKNGLDVRFSDIRKDFFPKADYVIMSASLYHFYDDLDNILKKMIDSADKGLFVIEPVSNHSSSKNLLVKKLAQFLSNPGIGKHKKRFSPDNFRSAMDRYSPKAIDLSQDKKHMIAYFEFLT